MKDDPEQGDRQFHRLLRDLPLRQAPASLESRVVGELERRSRLAWWRRGFAYWPLAARALFVLASSTIVGFTLRDGLWGPAGAWASNRVSLLALSWTRPAFAAASSMLEVAARAAQLLPSGWVYGAGAAAALLYATLFGLGAAAYRILYCQPSKAGLAL